MSKTKIACLTLADCCACSLIQSMLDQRRKEAADLFEWVTLPFHGVATLSERCALGLIQGACLHEAHVRQLEQFRARCDLLLAVGSCAADGGYAALRNRVTLKQCLEQAYRHDPILYNPMGRLPDDPELPLPLDRVYACNEIVSIDCRLPGCPPTPDALWQTMRALLADEPIRLPYDLIKYD